MGVEAIGDDRAGGVPEAPPKARRWHPSQPVGGLPRMGCG
jgi:hypothetical protein